MAVDWAVSKKEFNDKKGGEPTSEEAQTPASDTTVKEEEPDEEEDMEIKQEEPDSEDGKFESWLMFIS